MKKMKKMKKMNDAKNYGWEVKDEQAREAYDFAINEGYWDKEKLDYDIVMAMGTWSVEDVCEEIYDTKDIDELYATYGEDEVNAEIVNYISDEELASNLAYIFRMNDFREWEESLEKKENFNPIEYITSKGKENVFEMENGDILHIGFDEDEGVLYCGSATNTGIMREYEIDYDFSESVYYNLQALYEKANEDGEYYVKDSKCFAETPKEKMPNLNSRNWNINSDKKISYKTKGWKVGDSVEGGTVIDYDDKNYYIRDNNGCVKIVAKDYLHKPDENFYVACYYDDKYRGLAESETFEYWDDAMDYVWEKSQKGYFIQVENQETGTRWRTREIEEDDTDPRDLLIKDSKKVKDAPQKGNYIRLDKKKNVHGEYVVKDYQDGKFNDEDSAYDEDWNSAVGIFKDMAKKLKYKIEQNGPTTYIARMTEVKAKDSVKVGDLTAKDLPISVKEAIKNTFGDTVKIDYGMRGGNIILRYKDERRRSSQEQRRNLNSAIHCLEEVGVKLDRAKCEGNSWAIELWVESIFNGDRIINDSVAKDANIAEVCEEQRKVIVDFEERLKKILKVELGYKYNVHYAVGRDTRNGNYILSGFAREETVQKVAKLLKAYGMNILETSDDALVLELPQYVKDELNKINATLDDSKSFKDANWNLINKYLEHNENYGLITSIDSKKYFVIDPNKEQIWEDPDKFVEEVIKKDKTFNA